MLPSIRPTGRETRPVHRQSTQRIELVLYEDSRKNYTATLYFSKCMSFAELSLIIAHNVGVM